jgi:hypothetical protein
MRVKMILPALTEATSPFWRPSSIRCSRRSGWQPWQPICWQAAWTVNAVLAPGLLEHAVDAGLRSLFVGFETLNPLNLAEQDDRRATRAWLSLRRDAAVR